MYHPRMNFMGLKFEEVHNFGQSFYFNLRGKQSWSISQLRVDLPLSHKPKLCWQPAGNVVCQLMVAGELTPHCLNLQ